MKKGKLNIWTLIAIMIICVPIGYVGTHIVTKLLFAEKKNVVSQTDTRHSKGEKAKSQFSRLNSSKVTNPDSVTVTQAKLPISETATAHDKRDNISPSSDSPKAKEEKTGVHHIGSYAIWTGKLKGGKPHGEGKMTFITSHSIDGERTAKAGDYIENAYYVDGELQYGTWCHQDGTKEEQIEN